MWSKKVGLVAASLIALIPGRLLQAQTPSVTVGGVAYAQFLYQLKDSANHTNNFDVTRAYINVNGKFAYGVGSRVTGDIYRNADGSLAYRLKYAYASWSPEKSGLTFKFGEVQTPWIDYEEGLWGYRMQGTIAVDRNGFMTSSDFGLSMDGSWGYDRFNMTVGVYNGEGYSKVPGDQRKDIMGRASLKLLNSDVGGRDGGLRITGYAQLGKPTSGGKRQRFIGMLSYRSKLLTLAAEYAAAKDTVTSPAAPEKNARIISGFGVLRIPNSKLEIIGRVDSYDPNSDVDGDRQTRIIAGAAYNVSSNLRVLLDLDNVSYQSTPIPAQEAVRSQALFQIQITF